MFKNKETRVYFINKYISRFRILRVRLRYYYYRVIYKYTYLTFMWDNSRNYKLLHTRLKNHQYKKAIILGNAANLDYLTQDKYKNYQDDEKAITIGLNNSFLMYQADIVLWGEQFVLKKLLEQKDKIPYTIFIFASQLLNDRQRGLLFWKDNKTFESYPLDTIFKARTILASALYMCYTLGIKEIHLYGVSLDNYSHFYTHEDVSDSRNTFEFLSEERINEEYYGYSVYKIVSEVIEYLISDGFIIYYGGESSFLANINGIKKC